MFGVKSREDEHCRRSLDGGIQQSGRIFLCKKTAVTVRAGNAALEYEFNDLVVSVKYSFASRQRHKHSSGGRQLGCDAVWFSFANLLSIACGVLASCTKRYC